jgi:menaquinone-9 beta-reductase
MKPEVDVAVLGAGPGAVAAAVSLKKLGHSVMLLGVSRNASVEGMSRRAHALLGALGLERAAGVARGPGTRGGTWAGVAIGTNGEYIIERAEFDRAMSLDAVSHSVIVRNEWVTAVERHGPTWCVRTPCGEIRCRAVVDARGRRIRRASQRGPSLIAIAQRLEGIRPLSPHTLVYPMESGWCWFAADGQGTGALQLVTSPAELSASRAELAQLMLECMPAVVAVPSGLPIARAATARMTPPSSEEGYVRAGDAAVACDPLSGHGLYEALRSARVAAAAVHTYLTRGAWDVVDRFLTEASRKLWQSIVGAASAFYQQQAACTPTPFWTQTARAYSDLRGSNS